MNILCLSPHTDDCEMGCGGTIAKLVEQGNKIKVVNFSYLFNKGNLAPEAVASSKILGVNFEFINLDVRRFNEKRQEILDSMIFFKKEFQPDLVFLPSSFDIHQDHRVIYEEGVRAFKNCKMLGYEVPWNNFSFEHSTFSVLEERHLQKKIEAVGKYVSQKDRKYTNPEFIKSLAIVRGVQVGAEYAECFQTIRNFI